MSQNIFDEIIPSTTSGNQLAAILNDWKAAEMSGRSGTTRPSQLEDSGTWVKNDVANTRIFNFYDGTQDIEVFRVDTTTGKVSFPGTTNEFNLSRISDDAIGPILKFAKSRATGAGQTLENDILGETEFFGKQDDGNEAIQASVQVISTDDTTASAQGSDLIISLIRKATGSLTEKLRIKGSGQLGLGLSSPDSNRKAHFRGDSEFEGIVSEAFGDIANPGVIAVKKKRVLDSGQVKSGDTIGQYDFLSTDQNGAEVVSARMIATATEDHTDTAQGTNLSIFTKVDGQNTFQEAIKIENGKVTILGVESGIDSKLKQTLEDSSTTRELFQMDGSVYGSFEITANFRGRDNSETRGHIYKISGVYDSVNTEWLLDYSDSITKGSDPLVNLDIPSVAVQNLVVNYVNQFADIDFIDGVIYLDIRRNQA